MLEVKRDTAVFSRRQWYVTGFTGPECWFSTKEDAEAAVKIAEQHAIARTDRFARKIIDYVSDVDLG